MKWLRALPDKAIGYVADQFYDRRKARLLDDLAPFIGPEIHSAASVLDDLKRWLP